MHKHTGGIWCFSSGSNLMTARPVSLQKLAEAAYLTLHLHRNRKSHFWPFAAPIWTPWSCSKQAVPDSCCAESAPGSKKGTTMGSFVALRQLSENIQRLLSNLSSRAADEISVLRTPALQEEAELRNKVLFHILTCGKTRLFLNRGGPSEAPPWGKFTYWHYSISTRQNLCNAIKRRSSVQSDGVQRLVCCLISGGIHSPFFTLLPLFLFVQGGMPLVTRLPICPAGHVAKLNQKPGDGHKAAQSPEAKPKAKSPNRLKLKITN